MKDDRSLQAVRDEVFVHEQGLCESDAVGAGTRIWAFAHVLAGARVGRGCNICDGAFVEGGAVVGDRVTIKNQAMIWDGVEIGDDCFIGPGVAFTNDRHPRSRLRPDSGHLQPTRVGQGATIGANATVVCGIEIGAHAFIGAGAVVLASFPAHAFVVGNPGRRIGWACACGHRLDGRLGCEDCGRHYDFEAGVLTEAPGAGSP